MDKIWFSLVNDDEIWTKALNSSFCKGINQDLIDEFASPTRRLERMAKIAIGEWEFSPPHLARIPKDGEYEEIFDELLQKIIKKQKYREVWVLLPQDRILASAIGMWLFKHFGHWVHPSCYSYQEGIGCSNVVTKLSRKIVSNTAAVVRKKTGETDMVKVMVVAISLGVTVGWKSDLSKYFDSVKLRYIEKQWDRIEQAPSPDGTPWGKSCIIDLVRKFYRDERYYLDYHRREEDLRYKYQSLKQGVAIASWLADVVLYHIDEKLNGMGLYARYSDDQIFVGPRYLEAMDILRVELQSMEMDINEKKREWIRADRWVKFLGYAIKGNEISISKNRLANFEQEVKARTVDKIKDGITYDKALRDVQSWLYYGDGEHSWATGMLKTVNVKADICKMNAIVMDCLRAVQTGRYDNANDIGGLGWVNQEHKYVKGVVDRGKGRKVRSNRERTGDDLAGFYSLNCMRNRLLYGKDVYDATVRNVFRKEADEPKKHGADFKHLTYDGKAVAPSTVPEEWHEIADMDAWLDKLEDLYDDYKFSMPTKDCMRHSKSAYFKALTDAELGRSAMGCPFTRDEAQQLLEVFVIWGFASGIVKPEVLFRKDFFFQGTDKSLVLLKEWF